MGNKNIISNLSLENYKKKYKVRNYRLIRFTKKEVEDFDKKYPNLGKNLLLKNRKWALIGDTYYEIPLAPRFTWFRNLNAGIQAGVCLLGAGVVATAITVPLVVMNKTIEHQAEVDPEVTGVTITQKTLENGALEITMSYDTEKKEIESLEIYIGNEKLEINKDYILEGNKIIINKETLDKNKEKKIIIKPKLKDKTSEAGEIELETEFSGDTCLVGFKSIKKEGLEYNVTIPETIKHEGKDYKVIGLVEDAFNGKAHPECEKLNKVELPNTITKLEDNAFAYSGITSINIPKSVEEVEKFTFTRCNNLKSLVVDKGNKKYDSRDNCNSIIYTANNELILGTAGSTIPNTVKSIASSAFAENTGLKSIHIPASVEKIGYNAFSLDINQNESGLESVTFDDNSNLIYIEKGSFANQSALTSISLPASLENIGYGAFVRTGLTKAEIKGEETIWFRDGIEIDFKDYTPEKIATELKNPIILDRRREVELNYYISNDFSGRIEISASSDKTVEAHQKEVNVVINPKQDYNTGDLEISFVIYVEGTPSETGYTKVSKKVHTPSLQKDKVVTFKFTVDLGYLINKRVYPTILITKPSNNK